MFHLLPKSLTSCQSSTFSHITVGAILQVHYSHTFLLGWVVALESLAKTPSFGVKYCSGRVKQSDAGQTKEHPKTVNVHMRMPSSPKQGSMQVLCDATGCKGTATSGTYGGHFHYLKREWQGRDTHDIPLR